MSSAGNRQDEDFRQVLPHDAIPACAERHADRDFATAQRCARHQQVRHVDARDEEHANPGAEHRVEQTVDFGAEDGPRVRHHIRADAPVRGWEISLELRRNRLRLRPRLGEADVRLEPGDHQDVGTLPSRFRERLNRQWRPQRFAGSGMQTPRASRQSPFARQPLALMVLPTMPGELPKRSRHSL